MVRVRYARKANQTPAEGVGEDGMEGPDEARRAAKAQIFEALEGKREARMRDRALVLAGAIVVRAVGDWRLIDWDRLEEAVGQNADKVASAICVEGEGRRDFPGAWDRLLAWEQTFEAREGARAWEPCGRDGWRFPRTCASVPSSLWSTPSLSSSSYSKSLDAGISNPSILDDETASDLRSNLANGPVSVRDPLPPNR